MPISIDTAKKYGGQGETQVKIMEFLEKNRGNRNAYESDEIMRGIGMKAIRADTDEKGSAWTLKNFGLFALVVARAMSVQGILDDLVRQGKIKSVEVHGKTGYYMD